MNVPITKIAATIAAASLVAACGGGGDSAPSLEITGVAATGHALAGSPVRAKCAAGSGNATADGNGQYTLRVADGQLPCMIQVVQEVNGTSVPLHSLVETGTSGGSTITAVANVTPLTEMIVAHLAAALPASLFENFGSDKTISTEQITTSTTTVLSVIRDVTGIDGSGLDPFKAPLVAASPENTAGGNDHDKLLDKLGATVPAGSLTVIASQIANAASAGSVSSARQALTTIFDAAYSGAMPGCWVAKSGAYRAIDYFGATAVRHVDFKTLKLNHAKDEPPLDIKPLDPARPCEFTATGTAKGAQVEHKVVIGPVGAGAYRLADAGTNTISVGHLFPVQAINVADVQGEWRLARSGDSGVAAALVNTLSQAQVNGTEVETCDYDTAQNFACLNASTFALSPRDDGGINLIEGAAANTRLAAQVYGFQGADKTLVLYGTSNAAGAASGAGNVRTHFVATRPRTLTLPSVNDVSRYWDASISITQNTVQTTLEANAVTIIEADPSTSTTRRVRRNDGRRDRMRYNFQIDGVRLREAGVHNGSAFAAALQLPLPIGVTLSINGDTIGEHFYVISVVRP